METIVKALTEMLVQMWVAGDFEIGQLARTEAATGEIDSFIILFRATGTIVPETVIHAEAHTEYYRQHSLAAKRAYRAYQDEIASLDPISVMELTGRN